MCRGLETEGHNLVASRGLLRGQLPVVCKDAWIFIFVTYWILLEVVNLEE